MDIYATAWKKGLKSTYYLHMKPRHTAEQSTVEVNKREKLGKIGFGAVVVEVKKEPESEPLTETAKKDDNEMSEEEYNAMMAKVSMTEKVSKAGPTDPQEKFLCDSCQ